jgi:Asp-tRNA(Asn)/Glu-tRNA(Gln) amidotransferase A subunit family amidase
MSSLTGGLFLDYNIEQLHSLIRSKDINHREIVEECISKSKKIDPKYHIWSFFDEEEVIKQVSDKFLLTNSEYDMSGIPVAIKDIFNTKILPTQMGSPIWKNFIAGNDARVIHNLKEAGAIIPGKTVTAEFAVHKLNETLNPHDITITPGTSSSGSAVSVAMGVCPAAIGSQTAGSIVRPASFTGVYGFKPSYGLVPRTGMLKTTDTLDSIGFFTIHYKDLRRVFEAIRVRGKNYPLSNGPLTDIKRQNKNKSKPWRVAFVKTYTWNYAEQYAKNSIEQYIAKLSNLNDVEVKEVKLPKEFERIHELHSVIYKKALSYYFSKEYKTFDQMSDIMIDLIEEGLKISPADYNDAINEQLFFINSMDKIMQKYDVLLSLSTAGIAPPREIEEKIDSSLIWNTLQLPTAAVPGFTNNNIPFGFQVCSRKYNDLLLLNFLDYIYEKEMIPQKMYPML